jgi:hypothetical protein
MDYQKMYDDLINFRQEHPAQGYTERHHIIMRSMGGSNDDSNLVILTGREHWIAHLLLHKIYRRSETAHACNMMAMRCEERGIGYIKNSRMYEKIRKECAKLSSLRMQSLQAGKRNSQYGTRWICNIELKENKKISKQDAIPNGWISGRNKWNIRIKDSQNTDQKSVKSKSNLQEEARRMWSMFILGNYKSVNEFAKNVNMSQRVLSSRFSKYIPEYTPIRRKAYSSINNQ